MVVGNPFHLCVFVQHAARKLVSAGTRRPGLVHRLSFGRELGRTEALRARYHEHVHPPGHQVYLGSCQVHREIVIIYYFQVAIGLHLSGRVSSHERFNARSTTGKATLLSR